MLLCRYWRGRIIVLVHGRVFLMQIVFPCVARAGYGSFFALSDFFFLYSFKILAAFGLVSFPCVY